MASTDVYSTKIDPENLLNVSFMYNFDPLKNAITQILDQLRDNTANIAFLKEKAGIPATQIITPVENPNLILELKTKISNLEDRLSFLEKRENNRLPGTPRLTSRVSPRKVEVQEQKPVSNFHSVPPVKIPDKLPVDQATPQKIDLSPVKTEQVQAKPEPVLAAPASVPTVEIKTESPKLDRSNSMLFQIQEEFDQRVNALEIEVKKLKMRNNKIGENLEVTDTKSGRKNSGNFAQSRNNRNG